MKPFILLAFVAWSVAPLCAQNKLPKIRHHSGFFTDRFELGDKDVKRPEIRLHLQQHNNEAYYQFRRSESLSTQGALWMIVGIAGSVLTLTQLLKDDPNTSIGLTGAGIGIAGYTGSIICFSISGAKQQKALDIYNKAAGY